MGRPLRADAERSVRVILEAAEQVLAADPGASLEQIAQAAGVARTTVHRRFAGRGALIEALGASAMRQLAEAIEDAHPDTAPPLVALHRATANVLRVKSAWRYALGTPSAEGPAAAATRSGIDARCLELFARAQQEGVFDASADLDWVRRVYYALIGEALHHDMSSAERDPDAPAALVVETLLRGTGPRPRPDTD
ncbi:TetR/AcrR family transcriptional regulator [Streptomyces sp. NPDC002845]